MNTWWLRTQETRPRTPQVWRSCLETFPCTISQLHSIALSYKVKNGLSELLLGHTQPSRRLLANLKTWTSDSNQDIYCLPYLQHSVATSHPCSLSESGYPFCSSVSVPAAESFDVGKYTCSHAISSHYPRPRNDTAKKEVYVYVNGKQISKLSLNLIQIVPLQKVLKSCP